MRFKKQQEGEGIFNDLLRSAKALAGATEIYPDRPGYPEENHAVFLDKGDYYKKIAMAAGPGTRIDARLKRGDDKVKMAPLDKAAFKHDIAYRDIGKKDIPKIEKIKQIHNADIDFMKEITGDKVTPITSAIAKKAISLKMLAESTGLLPPEIFSLAGAGIFSEIEREVCFPSVIMEKEVIEGQRGGFLPMLITAVISTLAPIAINKISELLKQKGGGDDVKTVTMELSKQTPLKQVEIISKAVKLLGTDAFKQN